MAVSTLNLWQLSDWARGSLRDQIGPPAAEVVMRVDKELLLYGAVQPETMELYEQLDEEDRQIVLRVMR